MAIRLNQPAKAGRGSPAKPLALLRTFIALLLWLLLASAQAQLVRREIVYDNTRFPVLVDGNQQYLSRTNEIGDEISLAGTARIVTEFLFEYFGDFRPDGDERARVRFYANDGPGVYLKPQTVLWDSGWTLPVGTNRYARMSLQIPDIVVPDTFTWSVEFEGVTQTDGDRLGLLLYHPPTVGAPLAGGKIGSYNDYWRNTRGVWSFFQINNGAIPANFAARVIAVPEPSTLGLALAAGIVWVGWRCRRR